MIHRVLPVLIAVGTVTADARRIIEEGGGKVHAVASPLPVYLVELPPTAIVRPRHAQLYDIWVSEESPYLLYARGGRNDLDIVGSKIS